MLTRNITITSLLVAATAGTSLADVGFHITGDTWGGWLIFSTAPDFGPTNQYAFTDGGTGVPMDFMMDLPSGELVDGAAIDSRMMSADISGNVGEPILELTNWSLWVGTSDISLHVTWDFAAAPIALENLGSSGKDGVSYGAYGLNETLDWTLERADGSVENFSTNFHTFEFSAPIPAPGSFALLGMGGLVAARRRR